MDAYSNQQLPDEIFQQNNDFNFVAANQSDDEYIDVETTDMAEQAEGYAELAKDLCMSGSYEKAVAQYEACLEAAPFEWSKRASTLGWKAVALFKLKRFEEALMDCEHSLQLDPSCAEMQLLRGRALLALQNTDIAFCGGQGLNGEQGLLTVESLRASQHGSSAVQQAPDSAADEDASSSNPTTFTQDLGGYCFHVGSRPSPVPVNHSKHPPVEVSKFHAARPSRSTKGSKAVSRSDQADKHYELGAQLYAEGSYAGALAELDCCLAKASPGWSKQHSAVLKRALVLMHLKRYVTVIEACELALQTCSTIVLPALQELRGLALLRLGKLSEAEAAFHDLWRTKPETVLTAEEMQDLNTYNSALDELGNYKTSAKMHLKIIAQQRACREQLSQCLLHGGLDEALRCCDDIMLSSPQDRSTQIIAAQIMCELQRYDECASTIVAIMYENHHTVLQLHASSIAVFPVVAQECIPWQVVNGKLICDVKAIAELMLCMGAQLACVYTAALKNTTDNRMYGTEIRAKLHEVLTMLTNRLPGCESEGDWLWITDEEARMRDIHNHKLDGDDHLSDNNVVTAVASYTEALLVDSSARMWNAGILCDRAAVHAQSGMHHLAIEDCTCAIELDAGWCAPYLLRARSHRAQNHKPESVCDYEHYLAYTPAPPDYDEVRSELEDYVRTSWECKVCMDAFGRTEVFPCPQKCGTFTCWDCLLQSYKMAAQPGAIQGQSNTEGELLCSDIQCKCPVRIVDLARSHAPETVLQAREEFLVHVHTTKKVSEALRQQEGQIRGEYARIEQIKDADERAAAKMRLKIVDEVLTLRCPRCSTAFMDFEGCFALQCGNGACRCGFCAWCLKDCGNDAHAHVMTCPENQGKGYFNTEPVFQQHHKKRRTTAIKRLLVEAALNKNATVKLREMVRTDLRDLKIPINEVFPNATAPARAVAPVRAPRVLPDSIYGLHQRAAVVAPVAPAVRAAPAAHAVPLAHYHNQYDDYDFDDNGAHW